MARKFSVSERTSSLQNKLLWTQWFSYKSKSTHYNNTSETCNRLERTGTHRNIVMVTTCRTEDRSPVYDRLLQWISAANDFGNLIWHSTPMTVSSHSSIHIWTSILHICRVYSTKQTTIKKLEDCGCATGDITTANRLYFSCMTRRQGTELICR